MTKQKTLEQTYQVLDEIDHIRKRTGMYAGSTALQASEEFIYDATQKKMIKRSISYVPALVKIFSEILDNAIDESKRSKKLDTIKVEIGADGEISVYDNGRGIPVEIHTQTGHYIAETVFSNLRAGSNFNDEDDQSLIGTNGVGSTLTNVLSTKFLIESCDGKKLFKQEFNDGMRKRGEPKIKDSDKNHTKITFIPDYEFFKIGGLNEDHRLKMIKKVVDAAGNNPHVKFYIDGERLTIKSFEDYVKLFAEEYVYEENEDWKVAVAHSDGFQHVSFVNSVETYNGGTHIDYVMSQVTDRLREFFKKKHKIDVKPSDIKGHLGVYISCNINRPKFSSQTKENMISLPSEYKTSFKVSDKLISKLVKSPVMQAILDWVEAKSDALERAKLRELNKDNNKADPRRVPKFEDASEKVHRDRCILFVTEGDSAAKAILSARDRYMGSFPLKGKPLNVNGMPAADLIENKEFKHLLIITGLKLGEEVKSLKQLRFGKIALMSDQDLDGFHIRGLLINMLHAFWPEVFKLGFVYTFKTPLVKVTIGKEVMNFYTENDFLDWKEKNQGKKFASKYFKGLGTSTSKDFKEYLENMKEHLVPYEIDNEEDSDCIELAFSKAAGQSDKRKVWLDLEDK